MAIYSGYGSGRITTLFPYFVKRKAVVEQSLPFPFQADLSTPQGYADADVWIAARLRVKTWQVQLVGTITNSQSSVSGATFGAEYNLAADFTLAAVSLGDPFAIAVERDTVCPGNNFSIGDSPIQRWSAMTFTALAGGTENAGTWASSFSDGSGGAPVSDGGQLNAVLPGIGEISWGIDDFDLLTNTTNGTNSATLVGKILHIPWLFSIPLVPDSGDNPDGVPAGTCGLNLVQSGGQFGSLKITVPPWYQKLQGQLTGTLNASVAPLGGFTSTLSGTVSATMTPVSCFQFKNRAGVPVWDESGNLLLPSPVTPMDSLTVGA